MPNTIFGYFESLSDTPTFDPGDQAPCPGCGESVGRIGVRSPSVLVPGDYRCYFYRYHIACEDEDGVEAARDAIAAERFPVVAAIVAAQWDRK